ncbi:hypothetical protein JKP88DRAFT_286697 [Tribonema minus]|uniref:Uncharacterized protein n=1 Tax=Tribonema minus TaxID=303371 RepID=A0A835Z9H2_9STRA|nr:hypothetical protein JKP88DRAFT_286697 [Tribonema minus]
MEDLITGDLPDVPAITPGSAAAYCKDGLGAAAEDAAQLKACVDESVKLGWFGSVVGMFDLTVENTPFYDGPIDDMLTFVYMDNNLPFESPQVPKSEPLRAHLSEGCTGESGRSLYAKLLGSLEILSASARTSAFASAFPMSSVYASIAGTIATHGDHMRNSAALVARGGGGGGGSGGGGVSSLMYSGIVFSRTAGQDAPYKRPFLSVLGINTAPEVVEYLVKGGALEKSFLHEMLHSVGIGNKWPTPAGCGNLELCKATVEKEVDADAEVRQPIPYTPAGAAALCKADEIYRKECAASEWCTARNGDMPLLVGEWAPDDGCKCAASEWCMARNGDVPLLVESAAPATKDDLNFGSNCAHWPEAQLPAEIISTNAAGKKPFGGARGFLTAVTAGALDDLGYEVNYDSKEIDDFDLVNSRMRELDGLH